MNSIDTWSPWIAIIVAGGPGLLAVMNLAFSLYLSNRYMEALKGALKNSRYIYLWGFGLGRKGLIWALLDMAKITGMIMMPKTHIRIGDLDPIDYKQFPVYLKCLLKVNFIMMIAVGVWLVVLFFLLKFR